MFLTLSYSFLCNSVFLKWSHNAFFSSTVWKQPWPNLKMLLINLRWIFSRSQRLVCTSKDLWRVNTLFLVSATQPFSLSHWSFHRSGQRHPGKRQPSWPILSYQCDITELIVGKRCALEVLISWYKPCAVYHCNSQLLLKVKRYGAHFQLAIHTVSHLASEAREMQLLAWKSDRCATK